MIFAELYNSREEISTFGPDTKTCVIMVEEKRAHPREIGDTLCPYNILWSFITQHEIA